MRAHLPPEMLFLGTMTSAPFYLFTFFMLTDPKTSPASPRAQVLLALAIALVDLYLHKLQSVFTFFYAALHFSVWIVLDHYFNWSQMGADIVKRPYITVGMLAFTVGTATAFMHQTFLLEPVGVWRGAVGFLLFAIALRLMDTRS